MKLNHSFTYFILILFISVGTVLLWSRQSGMSTSVGDRQSEATKMKQREEEAKKRFPVADFNEPESPDQTKRAEQKAKTIRHNGLGLVNKTPDADSGGGVFIPERQFDFPALPVANSDVIVVGEILDAQAHLSEDKTNVFSEFTVRITNQLKPNTLLTGKEIVVERLGGYVQYADGRKLLYRIGTAGMPRVGGQYVLLFRLSSQEFSILSGYEFNEKGVAPLDDSRQFESLRGLSESAFLSQLHDAVSSGKLSNR